MTTLYKLKLVPLVLAFFLGGAFAQAQMSCRSVFQPLPWGQLSIYEPLDSLEAFFMETKGQTDRERVKALMDRDVRKTLFKLQALTRMLSEQDPVFFEKQRTYFKGLEDVSGGLDLATSLRKRAEKMNHSGLIAHFQKREIQAQQDLINAFRRSGLWDRPEATVVELKQAFQKQGNWLEGDREREFLVNIIKGYAKKLHKEVKDREFDSSDIEKGLHSLRRHLRWILIQVMSLDGFVELRPEKDLSPEVTAWFEQAKSAHPEILNSKYMQVSPARVAKPIGIPKIEFAMITELVGQIGESKDVAELQIYFREAMESLGARESETQSVLRRLGESLKSEEVNHRELVNQIQDKLNETKLLKRFVQDLEEMNQQ